MEWRHKDWEAPAAWIQTRSAVVAFSSQPFLRESFSARPSCSSHLRPICATAPLDGFLFTECVFPNNPSCRRRRAAQNIYIHIDRIESRAAARRLPPVPRFFLRTRARARKRGSDFNACISPCASIFISKLDWFFFRGKTTVYPGVAGAAELKLIKHLATAPCEILSRLSSSFYSPHGISECLSFLIAALSASNAFTSLKNMHTTPLFYAQN